MRDDAFPIMGDRIGQRRGYMPMVILLEHEAQAQTNHGQSIRRLKERGGLSPSEAMSVITDKRYYDLWYVNGAKPDENATWLELVAIVRERFPEFDTSKAS